MYYSKKQLKNLMNSLAELIAIICSSGVRNEYLVTTTGYEQITRDYIAKLEHAFSISAEAFIQKLEDLKECAKREDEQMRPCVAREICLWIDGHLAYCQNDYRISLAPLIRINANHPVFIESLNNNVHETGIWINPKFSTYKTSREDSSEVRREDVNKASWEGINGELYNISYFVWNGRYNIKNVIIPDTAVCDEKGNFLSVAFAPMTCEKDLLSRTNVDVEFNGRKQAAFDLLLNRDPNYFSQRMNNDLELASDKNVDVMFMPEMLGTVDSYGKGKEYVEWVKKASKRLIEKDKHVPAMTVLPSYWHNRNNSATIVFNNGLVLGVQQKYEPFVSRVDSRMEALDCCDQKDMTIIHIPGVHRMAVIICSEYLADQQTKWSDILCRCLGVSMILVPSFSGGEQAFFNSLNRYAEYGTIVVWGNCCGAGNSGSKGIGGCSIASLSIQDRFGMKCKCHNSCDRSSSCIFRERLSVQMTYAKNDSHEDEHELEHFVE